MSYDIENAITSYVDEQIESRIEAQIDESYVIQDIKSDVDGLLSREDEIANEVLKQVITKLASSFGTLGPTFV